MTFNITLVGCGKMGSALLRGWIHSGIDARYSVLTRSGVPDEFRNHPDVMALDSPAGKPDILILAVKPQVMTGVCNDWKDILPADSTVLSVAAGVPVSFFEDIFGAAQPVIRAMPNTPSAIGRGITVCVANARISPEQQKTASMFLGVTGDVEWINEEPLMNAVTAVSGSGPAYLFHFVEALGKAGGAMGLSPDLAEKLARQTVTGSAALLDSDPDKSPEQRRIEVTSPGGTTQAGLDVLMQELETLLTKTTQAARKRGEELGKP